MDLSEIISYTNILKFILNKTTISYNELFIYDFIIKNKITNDTIDFLDKYNNYINNFYKNDTDELNNIINCNIDNNYETNPDEETYPEDDLTLDEDNLDSYDYNYIEDNKKGTYSHKQNYHNQDDEEDEEDEEDDEEEQGGEQNEESNEINVLKHNIKK